jgi:hypothetical protein
MGKWVVLSSVMKKLRQIVEDTWNSFEQVTQHTAIIFKMGELSDHASLR